MKSGESSAARRTAGVGLGALAAATMGGIGLAGVVAPSALAAPDCSPQAVQSTTDSVTTAAQQYLANHPDAQRVMMTAALQPRDQAEATVRNYTGAHQQETAEFKQILNPLYQTQQVCNVSVLPASVSWAFNLFMNS